MSSFDCLYSKQSIIGTVLVVSITLIVAKLIKSKMRPQFGCEAVENEIVRTDRPIVIAHRGAALDGPENTLGAIRKAAENGADGVEIDFILSADGHLVVMHDWSLDRTTDASGPVSAHSVHQLQSVNAAHKFHGWEFEPVPTLESVVVLAEELDIFLLIEAKSTSKKAVTQLLQLFENYPRLYAKSIVISFDYYFLYQVKSADRKVCVGPLYASYHGIAERFNRLPAVSVMSRVVNMPLHLCFHYLNASFFQFEAVLVHRNVFTNENYKDYWTRRGVKLFAWTVNDRVIKQKLMNESVSVVTDSLAQ